MPKKNSPTKPVHSFRLSLECVRQLKDLSGIMGRSEGDVVEVSIDRMYRGELRFGNLMIGDAGSDIGASTARSGKTVSIHAQVLARFPPLYCFNPRSPHGERRSRSYPPD